MSSDKEEALFIGSKPKVGAIESAYFVPFYLPNLRFL